MNGKKTGSILIFLLFGILILVFIPQIQAQGGVDVSQEEGSIVDLTGWKIFWNWVNFGILVYLLHRFLTKPVLEFLDARKKEVQSNLDNSESARKEADKILNEYRDKMAHARKEAMDIMEKAKQRGNEKEKELYAEAREKSKALLEEAKQEIQGEVDRARKELVSEVGQLSVKIASSIIQKEIDEQLSEKFIEEQIEKFGDIQ